MKDMEAKDLRLGNLVNNERGEVIRIVPSFILDIHYRKLIGAPEIFKPIELNDEWLIKLGCTGINHYSYGMTGWIGDFKVGITDGNAWLSIFGEPNGEYYVDLQYVHTFQNLMYALTGTEI